MSFTKLYVLAYCYSPLSKNLFCCMPHNQRCNSILLEKILEDALVVYSDELSTILD